MIEVFEFEHGYCGAKPRFVDRRLKFLFDSGSALCLWKGSLIRLQSLNPKYIGSSQAAYKDTNGNLSAADLYELKLEIGNFVWEKAHILVPKSKQDSEYDLLLGTSLFQDCKVEINFSERLISIDNQSRKFNCYENLSSDNVVNEIMPDVLRLLETSSLGFGEGSEILLEDGVSKIGVNKVNSFM